MMKIILLIAVSALLSEVASLDSRWFIGDEGESCNSVCRKNSRICNRHEQSRIKTGELFVDALFKAGYPMAKDTCKNVKPRKFSGSPCLAEGGKTCVVLPPSAKSGCDRPMHHDHRPLCSCLARPEHPPQEPTERPPQEPSTPAKGGCNPNFVDKVGKTCDDYLNKDWCTYNGELADELYNKAIDGGYGKHWELRWGTFDDYSKNGETAVVCPQCGCKATCEDGVQNQNEEGTDCGGPCPACQQGYEVKRGHACDGGYIEDYDDLRSAIEDCNNDQGCNCIEWNLTYDTYYTHASKITHPGDSERQKDADAWVKQVEVSIK